MNLREEPIGRQIEDAAREWRTQGWTLIPGLVPEADLTAAVEDLWQVFPRPEEFHTPDHPRRKAFLDSPLRKWPAPEVAESEHAFREEQFYGHRKFPFAGNGDLNRLVVHPRLLAFVEAALGSPNLRLYQAGVWAKYAGAANYAQPLHLDRNHSVVPVRMEPGWWFLEGFLYLDDVDAGNGAPELLRRRDAPPCDPGRPIQPAEAPELYANAVSAPGPRGSFLAYRGDVWHRSVDLVEPGTARFNLIVCFKLAAQEWIGFDAMSEIVDNVFFTQFVADSSPRDLALFGFPEPGHAYWTRGGVEALALKYPGLDVSPWRLALQHSS